MSIDDVSALPEAQEFVSALHSAGNERGMNGRTFEVLKDRRRISKQMLLSLDSKVHFCVFIMKIMMMNIKSQMI